ncbi:MAG TPA: phosphatidate cytidylyltransferase [Chitinophagaceae bacterium]|nr:phosphatidate cytidylyltransferase [Chitinophagaceae bacterium]
MAFNWQTFRIRTLTAAVFVAIMLTGLLWNFWSFLILFSVIHFGCWWEYIKLLRKIYSNKYLPYVFTGLIYITIPVLMHLSLYNASIYNLNHSWDCFNPVHKTYDFTSSIPIESNRSILIIFSLWLNDTLAYLIGSMIGKTPFSKISPKKTWEGTLGGIISTAIISALIAKLYLGFFYKPWIIISLVAAVFGTIGDLFESKLKRMANVKDSGTLMPGHGGFLDRFDSLLFATPFVWLYIQFLLK